MECRTSWRRTEAAIAEARPAMLADEGCLRYDLQRVSGQEGSVRATQDLRLRRSAPPARRVRPFCELTAKFADLLVAEPVVTLLKPVGEQVGLD